VGWKSPEVSVGVYSSDEMPECGISADGGAFVAWTFVQSGDFYPAYMQKVTATGASAPGWPTQGIPISAAGYSARPQVASDGAAGAFFAWENWTDPGPTDVLVQHVLAGGAIAPGWDPGGLHMAPSGTFAFEPSTLSTVGGAALVLWETLDGIYAQKVASAGVDYFTFAIANVTVEPDRAHLVWQSSAPWTGSVTIYRRDENGWSPLKAVPADADGRVTFEDTNVIPGGHYMYRVGATLHGTEVFYGEVEVQVPLFVLTVRSLTGNPARQDLSVSFTLPSAEAATLQLLDVRGRLVESSEVGQLGLGRHTITLGSSKRISSGIYLVRLAQGSRTTSAKIAFLR